jgi:phenylalanyl-tRNA synthetase beta subunit
MSTSLKNLEINTQKLGRETSRDAANIASLIQKIRTNCADLIKESSKEQNIFDSFKGASLGEDKKSLAIEVTLQPHGESLTDKQIEQIADKIIAAVTKATGGEIRG